MERIAFERFLCDSDVIDEDRRAQVSGRTMGEIDRQRLGELFKRQVAEPGGGAAKVGARSPDKRPEVMLLQASILDRQLMSSGHSVQRMLHGDECRCWLIKPKPGNNRGTSAASAVVPLLMEQVVQRKKPSYVAGTKSRNGTAFVRTMVRKHNSRDQRLFLEFIRNCGACQKLIGRTVV